jgi:hypothetical protein
MVQAIFQNMELFCNRRRQTYDERPAGLRCSDLGHLFSFLRFACFEGKPLTANSQELKW